MTDITVIFSLNIGCSSVLIWDQGDLTEVTSWAHNLNKSILSILICNSNFTFSFGDEEQFGGNLTLSDDTLFRIVHLKLHLWEKNINQLFIILEHRVGINYVLEDEFDDLVLQTRWDILYKQCKLLLILLTLLCILKETDNLWLKIWWQMNVLHCGVDLIKFLLEGVCLPIKILDEHSHITKDISINNGTNSVREHNKEYLNITNWEGIITSHQKHWMVNGHEVLPQYRIIIQVFIFRSNV